MTAQPPSLRGVIFKSKISLISRAIIGRPTSPPSQLFKKKGIDWFNSSSSAEHGDAYQKEVFVKPWLGSKPLLPLKTQVNISETPFVRRGGGLAKEDAIH